MFVGGRILPSSSSYISSPPPPFLLLCHSAQKRERGGRGKPREALVFRSPSPLLLRRRGCQNQFVVNLERKEREVERPRELFFVPLPLLFIFSLSQKGTRGLSINVFFVSAEKNYFSGAFLSNHVLLTSALR